MRLRLHGRSNAVVDSDILACARGTVIPWRARGAGPCLPGIVRRCVCTRLRDGAQHSQNPEVIASGLWPWREKPRRFITALGERDAEKRADALASLQESRRSREVA
eukprot:3517632-Prymnesium_polylepis.2